MQAFIEYFTSKEQLSAAITRQKSTIISYILLGMRGIEHDLNLPDDFKSAVESIGLKNVPLIQKLKPVINAGSVVRSLKDMLLDNEENENVYLSLLLQIFNKFHQRICFYGRLDDLAPILISGYQTLLILAGSSIFHPLIFQVVVSQLCRFVKMPTTNIISIYFIKHIASKSLHEQRYEFLNDHAILLLSSLESATQVSELNDEVDDSQLILSCAEIIISCIDQYSIKINDNGLSIRMACAVLGHPKFSILLKTFQCSQADSESLIKLATMYEPSHLYSGTPFYRLAALLDSTLDSKNISELLPLAQHIYFLTKSPAVVDFDIIRGLICLFSKLSFHLEINTVNLIEKSLNSPLLESINDYFSTVQILISYMMSDADTVVKCTSVLGRLLAEPEIDSTIFDLDSKISPYISILRGKKRTIFDESLDGLDLIFFSSNMSESQWLTQFTSKLVLKFNYPNFFRILYPLLVDNAEIASKMLPILIHFKLFQEFKSDEPKETSLTHSIVEFFKSNQDLAENIISYKHLLNVLKVRNPILINIWLVSLEKRHRVFTF